MVSILLWYRTQIHQCLSVHACYSNNTECIVVRRAGSELSVDSVAFRGPVRLCVHAGIFVPRALFSLVLLQVQFVRSTQHQTLILGATNYRARVRVWVRVKHRAGGEHKIFPLTSPSNRFHSIRSPHRKHDGGTSPSAPHAHIDSVSAECGPSCICQQRPMDGTAEIIARIRLPFPRFSRRRHFVASTCYLVCLRFYDNFHIIFIFRDLPSVCSVPSRYLARKTALTLSFASTFSPVN